MIKKLLAPLRKFWVRTKCDFPFKIRMVEGRVKRQKPICSHCILDSWAQNNRLKFCFLLKRWIKVNCFNHCIKWIKWSGEGHSLFLFYHCIGIKARKYWKNPYKESNELNNEPSCKCYSFAIKHVITLIIIFILIENLLNRLDYLDCQI